jgi:hypothetical protein
MALLGAATSCVNLLAVTVPVQAAMLEPDVIRYCELLDYELSLQFLNTRWQSGIQERVLGSYYSIQIIYKKRVF